MTLKHKSRSQHDSCTPTYFRTNIIGRITAFGFASSTAFNRSFHSIMPIVRVSLQSQDNILRERERSITVLVSNSPDLHATDFWGRLLLQGCWTGLSGQRAALWNESLFFLLERTRIKTQYKRLFHKVLTGHRSRDKSQPLSSKRKRHRTYKLKQNTKTYKQLSMWRMAIL